MTRGLVCAIRWGPGSSRYRRAAGRRGAGPDPAGRAGRHANSWIDYLAAGTGAGHQLRPGRRNLFRPRPVPICHLLAEWRFARRSRRCSSHRHAATWSQLPQPVRHEPVRLEPAVRCPFRAAPAQLHRRCFPPRRWRLLPREHLANPTGECPRAGILAVHGPAPSYLSLVAVSQSFQRACGSCRSLCLQKILAAEVAGLAQRQ